MICPKCGSSDVRSSRNPRWSDVFQQVRGREPFRCRECRRRFFASVSEPAPDLAGQPKSTQRSRWHISTRTKKRLARRLSLIVIFAVALIIFWLFLRYITNEPGTAPHSDATSSHTYSIA